jgi:hypothetical protein
MYNIIKQFFAWLFPIVRIAVIQVAAEELDKLAYPDRRRRRPTYTGRTGYRPYYGPTRDVFEKPANEKFHDVLMVAFDLKGPNAQNVHQWLMDQMPETGDHGDFGEINLDAWWVANDERFDGSDTDSAVFVPKGQQNECRQILAEHDFRHQGYCK